MSADLSRGSIEKKLTASILGRELIIFDTLGSTNTYVKQHAGSLAEGAVVIADGQTGGRGRFGRSFSSPRGEGVYMSVLLKPRAVADDCLIITLFGAVAVCRALEDVCGIAPAVKWVNDIYAGGKKICGILAESVIEAGSSNSSCVCVGFGINTGEVAAEVKDIATSVLYETGARVPRCEIIAGVLNRFEEIIIGAKDITEGRAVLREYSKRLAAFDNGAKAQQPAADEDALAMLINNYEPRHLINRE